MTDIRTVLSTTYRGQPAQISVLRNNGYCWGQLVTKSLGQFTIDLDRDLYDCGDAEVAEELDAIVQQAQGDLEPAPWEISWYDDLEAVS